MNREEVAYKLIELYYTNKNTFRDYRISLRDLIEKYQRVLEEIKDEELKERINKIKEIIELNQYNYGYQIKEEILKGED